MTRASRRRSRARVAAWAVAVATLHGATSARATTFRVIEEADAHASRRASSEGLRAKLLLPEGGPSASPDAERRLRAVRGIAARLEVLRDRGPAAWPTPRDAATERARRQAERALVQALVATLTGVGEKGQTTVASAAERLTALRALAPYAAEPAVATAFARVVVDTNPASEPVPALAAFAAEVAALGLAEGAAREPTDGPDDARLRRLGALLALDDARADAAAAALAVHPADSVAPLLAGASRVTPALVRALASSPDAAAVEALREATGSPNLATRSAALVALARRGEPEAVALAREWLAARNDAGAAPGSASSSASSASSASSGSTRPSGGAAPDAPELALAAAEVLCLREPEQATKELRLLLARKDTRTRAVELAAACGAPGALLLAGTLEATPLEPAAAVVAAEAVARELGATREGEPEVARALLEGLARALNGSSSPAEAAWALGASGAPEAAEPLLAALGAPERARYALRALVASGLATEHRAAVDAAAERLLGAGEPADRYTGAWALAALAPARGVALAEARSAEPAATRCAESNGATTPAGPATSGAPGETRGVRQSVCGGSARQAGALALRLGAIQGLLDTGHEAELLPLLAGGEDAEVRRLAGEALRDEDVSARVSTQQLAELLREALGPHPAAARALALRAGEPYALNLTLDLLRAPEAAHRLAAALGLGASAAPGARRFLEAAYAVEPDAAVRRALRVALRRAAGAAPSSSALGVAAEREAALEPEALAGRRGSAAPAPDAWLWGRAPEGSVLVVSDAEGRLWTVQPAPDGWAATRGAAVLTARHGAASKRVE